MAKKLETAESDRHFPEREKQGPSHATGGVCQGRQTTGFLRAAGKQ